MRTIGHWINGAEYQGNPICTIPVEDPGTGQVIAELLQASRDDLDHAVSVAREAQKGWARVPLAKRVDIMFRMRQLVLDNQEEMARLIVTEHGKNYSDAIGEIQRGRETLDFATAINISLKGEHSVDVSTGVDVHSLRQPVGVVAGITPFNFPAMVPMWMHPLAIATGNSFILKPPAQAPSAALLTAELYKRAGLPDGVFQVISGDNDLVTALVEHQGVDAISFVGSTPVARIITGLAQSAGKRVQALGGANNHAIVMPDADMDVAAEHISAAAFGAAGERCMALPVVVAVGGIGPDLARRIKDHAQSIHVGYGMDEGVEMGPVITAEAKKRITALIDDAEGRGADVVLDGRRLVVEGYEGGHFLGPTILDGVPLEAPVYHEEVFGPVLTIVHADSYEEALALVNSSPFGNGSAIFTNDGGRARAFTCDVEAGMVGVNVPIPTPVAYYSFGGWKASLIGDTHIHGPEGVRFYTRAKVVTSRWPSEKHAAATMSFKREE